MTETERKWAERVAEWRGSGDTAAAFCEGKDFTAGGLRYWSSRLRRRDEEGRGPRAPRMVRVVRAPAATEAMVAPLVIEVGRVRVGVRGGFDPQVLRAVVDALVGER